MRLLSLLLPLFLFAGLSTGCTEEEEPISTTLDAHVQMFSELLCAHSEECGPQPGWDFDTCLSKLSWSEEDLADFKALEEEGIASFDSEQSDACIEAIVFHACPLVITEERDGIAGVFFDIPECENVISYQASPL
jgi:hypothetical protein